MELNNWYRALLEYDKKGRVISKREIFSTKNPNDIAKLDKEIESNLLVYEKEQEEEKENAKYCYRNLVLAANHCLLLGLIPSDKRTDFIQDIKIDTPEEIKELVLSNKYEEFSSVFGKVAM